MSKFIDFINLGIFPGHILFSHGFSYDELMHTMNGQYKKKIWKEEQNNRLWVIGIDGDKVLIDGGNYLALKREIENKSIGLSKTLFYIIIKEDFKFTDYEYCKLAHEVLHICQFYLPDVLDRTKEFESEAYLHTHLMSQCLELLRSK